MALDTVVWWQAEIAWIHCAPRVIPMSTVTEIEKAFAKLPPDKLEELAAWLDDYRRMIHSSEAVFEAYQANEER